MIALARQHGAALVDGARAVMHHAVDVQSAGLRFLRFPAINLRADRSIGSILYVKEALLQEMPPWEGGGS